MEIERKFLVKRDDTFRKMVSSSSVIAQGYMDVKGATVRIRLRTPIAPGEKSPALPASPCGGAGQGVAYLTIKGPSFNGGISRYEFEREIPLEDAHEMLKLCRGGLVEKVRHLVPYEGHIFEVDEFHGTNEGLLFAEVELKHEEEQFDKPEWLGPEVTGNRHFYNKGLLSNPYPYWKSEVPEEYQ